LSNYAKYFTVLCAALLFGCATGNTDRSAQFQESNYAQWQLLDEYEVAMPALAGWGDYGSASRVALAIAFERNRLEGMTSGVCQALTQSSIFAGMDSAGRSREDFHVLAGIREHSGPMTRERSECERIARAAQAAKTAGSF
jgi:hypothetical protein